MLLLVNKDVMLAIVAARVISTRIYPLRTIWSTDWPFVIIPGNRKLQHFQITTSKLEEGTRNGRQNQWTAEYSVRARQGHDNKV
jgi:hypothetical protein